MLLMTDTGNQICFSRQGIPTNYSFNLKLRAWNMWYNKYNIKKKIIIWNLVERVRVELTTPRFSVLCSTCWATIPYGASGGTWTHNLQIKSLLLYRLSYRCIWHPEKESNLYLKIRSFLFFPLNYRGIWWNRPVSNWLPLDFQSSALPVELLFHMVHLAGLEPATFGLKICYSAKLSYRCK